MTSCDIFQVVFNEALAKVVEEKDKVIEQLRERERELLHEKDRDHGRCCHLVREYAGMSNVRKTKLRISITYFSLRTKSFFLDESIIL